MNYDPIQPFRPAEHVEKFIVTAILDGTYPAGSITGPHGEVFVPRTEFFDWSELGKEKINAAEVRRQYFKGNFPASTVTPAAGFAV